MEKERSIDGSALIDRSALVDRFLLIDRSLNPIAIIRLSSLSSCNAIVTTYYYVIRNTLLVTST